ncbi:hypothetical protein [Xenorhabdus hominickii]|uniref:3-oxoacyl-ACP reductase n=1 Tax=Xenorhabdus hominickii TaxID=351679 RepID=A0A2G0Q2U4_XENHO|nr:hypothetical protein [Xenorhabdus hominickii]PHM53544.1 3-oxoacyl-ACP reductase [Xenorhabdus hominickii]
MDAQRRANRFNSKVVIVTDAGSGIGAATVQHASDRCPYAPPKHDDDRHRGYRVA